MDPDHRALGDDRVARDDLFDGAGGQPVPRDVDDVVDAAHDGHVAPRVRGEVRRHEPLVVAPQRGQRTGRQRQPDDDLAVGTGRCRFAHAVHDAHVVPGYRYRRRTGLRRSGFQAHQVRRDRPTRLGLPPVVDDRDAEQVVRPRVGLGIEPLAGQKQVTEPRQVVALEQLALRILTLDGPEAGGGGEERLDAVFGDDPPERAGVRRADRLALVQDRRTAGDERRVHDVRVPDDPSDVGGCPVDLAGPGVVDVLHAPAQRDGVPAVVAHHALGPGRGARRVEDVQPVGCGDRYAVGRFGAGHRLGPVHVPPGYQLRRDLRTLQDHAVPRRVVGQLDRLVQDGLVLEHPVDFDAAGRGDDHLRRGVVDAQRQLVRREPAEHDRVHRPDPGTRQHRDDGLGHHRQVDDHPVAVVYAQAAQYAGEPGHLVAQFAVRERAAGTGHRAVVDQCALLGAPVPDVPVHRVEAGVQHAVGKPLDRLGRRTPEPVRIGDAAPERLRVAAHDGTPLSPCRAARQAGSPARTTPRTPRRPTGTPRTPPRPGRGTRRPSPRRGWPRCWYGTRPTTSRR